MMEFLSTLHLLRPQWLLLLAPLVALLWWLSRRPDASGSWQTVIAPALLPYLIENTGTRRRRTFVPLLAVAWTAAVVAIAGPSWQKLPQPVLQKQDALVLVLDLSYSMWAEDTRPSRIDRARRKLLDLLDMRREGQTGLIAYAGDAHVVTPLTDDHPTIANLLPALDPGMMPLPGSDPAAAVAAARELLSSAGVVGGRILLVTDGLEERDAARIRDALENSGASLSILGVGTTEGAPIPLPEGGFLKEDDGAIVMPKLPSSTLRRLAGRMNGRYQELTVDPSDLETLLAPVTGALDGDTREIDRNTDTWADMAHWFALPLLPVLLMAFRTRAVYALLPLLFLLPSEASRADGWRDLWLTPDQQATRALEAGDPEAAADRFVDPRWRGTAAYEAGDYAKAADSFEQVDSADGWYNRGNALAREGDLDAAINAYRESLERDPGREDAQENLELIQQLKQEQEQQEQEQQQPGEDGSPEQNQDSEQDTGGDNNSQSPGQQPSQSNGEQNPGQDGDAQDPGTDDASNQDQDASASEGGEEREAEGDQAGAADSREQPGPKVDTASSLAESLERDQAMQQWLRRVPDDPAGLLREKFRYESRRRQRKGEDGKENDKVW